MKQRFKTKPLVGENLVEMSKQSKQQSPLDGNAPSKPKKIKLKVLDRNVLPAVIEIEFAQLAERSQVGARTRRLSADAFAHRLAMAPQTDPLERHPAVQSASQRSQPVVHRRRDQLELARTGRRLGTQRTFRLALQQKRLRTLGGQVHHAVVAQAG